MNSFIEKIKQIELISKKYRKNLNYAEHLFILASTVMEWVFIFPFTSLVIIPVVPLGTKGSVSVAAIKIFAIVVKIKNY